MRLGNFQFETFTAHHFNQYGQVKFTTAGNLKCIGSIRIFYAKCYIRFNFLLQTGTDMTAGYEIAFLASKRTLIYTENHGQSRFINLNAWKCIWVICVSYGFTNGDVLEAGHSNNITHLSFLYRSTLHTDPCKERAEIVFSGLFSISNAYRHTLAGGASGDTSNGYLAQIFISIQCGNNALKWSLVVSFRSRAVFNNGFKQRGQILAVIIHAVLGNTISCRCINKREVQLVIISFQFNEQVEDFTFYIADTLIRAVNLVNNYNRLQMMFQCLA